MWITRCFSFDSTGLYIPTVMGHVLNLACGDAIKCALMKNALDTAYELIKLVLDEMLYSKKK